MAKQEADQRAFMDEQEADVEDRVAERERINFDLADNPVDGEYHGIREGELVNREVASPGTPKLAAPKREGHTIDGEAKEMALGHDDTVYGNDDRELNANRENASRANDGLKAQKQKRDGDITQRKEDLANQPKQTPHKGIIFAEDKSPKAEPEQVADVEQEAKPPRGDGEAAILTGKVNEGKGWPTKKGVTLFLQNQRSKLSGDITDYEVVPTGEVDPENNDRPYYGYRLKSKQTKG